MPALFQRYAINTTGRDYVVGDIHGCFSLLEALLAYVNFDTDRDRLFSVGDLIDHGPECDRVSAFLRQPWFDAIIGNHEAMLLEGAHTIDYAQYDPLISEMWKSNGGSWFFYLSLPDQEAVYYEIYRLPVAAEVALPGDGLAGLAHGDVGDNSWQAVREILTHNNEGADLFDFRDALLWSRTRAYAVMEDKETDVSIPGADIVFLGHTPMRFPVRADNTRWLDTGAGKGGGLSLAELSVNGRVWTVSPDGGSVAEGWRPRGMEP